MAMASGQRQSVWHLSPSGNQLPTDECQPREGRAFTCYPGAQLGFCALTGKDGSMQEQGMARRGGAAFIWKWGAISGVVLGVIQIIISLLPLGSLKTILDVLVWLIGFFVLGLFAARQTGRVRTGALVGLVAGLIGALIGRVLFVIIQISTNDQQITPALNHAAATGSISPGELHTVAVVGIVIGLVVLGALELGLGAGIGALGGLVGRRQAPPVASTPIAGTVWTPPPSAQ